MDFAKLLVVPLVVLAALPFLASDALDSDTIVLDGVRYTREELLMASEEWTREKQTLRILVVGETGVGKSALINALLLGSRGDVYEVAKEGHSLQGVTKQVREYREMMNGVLVSVFDTPGLQNIGNSVQVIEDIKLVAKSDIDLLLFCINMTDTRLQRYHHIETLKLVTDALGESIWERALVVLTRANEVEEPEPQKNLRKYFIRRVSEWESSLKKVAIERCSIPSTIVMKIPVVPAGYKNRSLPDCENWLSKLWTQAFRRLKIKAMIAFLKLSKNRLRRSIDDMVFTGLWTTQPIILSYMSYPEEMEAANNMATLGAVAGGAVGAVASLGVGPLAPLVGTYFGGVLGGLIGTFTGSESSQYERVILQSLITALQDELSIALPEELSVTGGMKAAMNPGGMDDAVLVSPGNWQEPAETGVLNKYNEPLQKLLFDYTHETVEIAYRAYLSGKINESKFEQILMCGGDSCNLSSILLEAIQYETYRHKGVFCEFVQLIKDSAEQPLQNVPAELQVLCGIQQTGGKLTVASWKPKLVCPVDSEGLQIYEWESHGITVDIPKGAIPEGQRITFVLTYEVITHSSLPDGYQLFSPVYTIMPSYTFQKNITLRIEHWAIIRNQSQALQLTFIRLSKASTSILNGGTFSTGDSWGVIETSTFSKYAIIAATSVTMMAMIAQNAMKYTHTPDTMKDTHYKVEQCIKPDDERRMAVNWTSYVCMIRMDLNLEMDTCNWLKRNRNWTDTPETMGTIYFNFAPDCVSVELDESAAKEHSEKQNYTFHLPSERKISKLSLDIKQYPEYRKLTVRALNPVPQSLETVLPIKCAKVYNTEEDLEISIKNPTDPGMFAHNQGSEHHKNSVTSEEDCTVIKSAKDAIDGLKAITAWKRLGEDLGVRKATIKKIDEDEGDAEQKRREVITAWFDNTTKSSACWEKIIQVLCQMEKARVAEEIATKYGCKLPYACGQH